jgi:hypothetical protein
MLDPYEIRFKHIDEVNGDVKTNGIDTYNFRYYFYSNYYTYTAGKTYKLDIFENNYQLGTYCNSYIDTRPKIPTKGSKCV